MPKNFVYINVKKKYSKKSNFNNLNSANNHIQIKF